MSDPGSHLKPFQEKLAWVAEDVQQEKPGRLITPPPPGPSLIPVPLGRARGQLQASLPAAPEAPPCSHTKAALWAPLAWGGGWLAWQLGSRRLPPAPQMPSVRGLGRSGPGWGLPRLGGSACPTPLQGPAGWLPSSQWFQRPWPPPEHETLHACLHSRPLRYLCQEKRGAPTLLTLKGSTEGLGPLETRVGRWEPARDGTQPSDV